MPSRAMCFSEVNTAVFGMGFEFKMDRVYTTSIPALVMDFQSLWNVCDKKFVAPSVSLNESVITELSVSSLGFVGGPIPTVGRFVQLDAFSKFLNGSRFHVGEESARLRKVIPAHA